MFKFLRSILTSLAAISLVLTACGGEEASVAEGSSLVVVTTNILGDVVEELVGDQLVVEAIMPPEQILTCFRPQLSRSTK